MPVLLDSGLTQAIDSGASMGLRLLALRQQREEAQRQAEAQDQYRQQELALHHQGLADTSAYHEGMMGIARDKLNQASLAATQGADSDVAIMQALGGFGDSGEGGGGEMSGLGLLAGNPGMGGWHAPMLPNEDDGHLAAAGVDPDHFRGARPDVRTALLREAIVRRNKADTARATVQQRTNLVKNYLARNVASGRATPPLVERQLWDHALMGGSEKDLFELIKPQFDPGAYMQGLGTQMGPDGQPLYKPNELQYLARMAGGSKRELTPEEISKGIAAANVPPPEKLSAALREVHPNATPGAADAAVLLRGANMPIGLGEANFTGSVPQHVVPPGSDRVAVALNSRAERARREYADVIRRSDAKYTGADVATADDVKRAARDLNAAEAEHENYLLNGTMPSRLNGQPQSAPVAPPASSGVSQDQAIDQAMKMLPPTATDQEIAAKVKELMGARP